MNDLYAECDCCKDLAAESDFSFDETVITAALKRIYAEDFNPLTDIEENLFNETWSLFCNPICNPICNPNTFFIKKIDGRQVRAGYKKSPI